MHSPSILLFAVVVFLSSMASVTAMPIVDQHPKITKRSRALERHWLASRQVPRGHQANPKQGTSRPSDVGSTSSRFSGLTSHGGLTSTNGELMAQMSASSLSSNSRSSDNSRSKCCSLQ
ncbi:hypothetical protein AMATHDRAFT_70878 [Amanita thiersii Skay4041]|uniref:Secreted protein n=1 Tax=Amanita thiersii Skay4041 TaxID=703135 RepID=A0A2A9NCF7_9AGAR|nr:hypothetical protein AMATHDRAFT_70878 [Amanita thiersii Skay4041]